MQYIAMVGQLLLGLSILVVVHEWGHFIACRIFGIRVEKFYLFFDPYGAKLFSFKKGDTEYGVGVLPLGGYVKIAGMIDESMDKEFLDKPAEPWEFRSKPAWQRLIVMLGGITMNTILGIVIFSMHTLFYGDVTVPVSELKYGIVAHDLAKEVGMKTGDKIVAVNNKPVKRLSDILDSKLILEDNVKLTINRYDTASHSEITKVISLPEDFGKKVLDQGLSEFIDFRFTFLVDSVMAKSGAEKGGLLKNDSITAINNQPVHFFDEIRPILKLNKDKNVLVTIHRKDKLHKAGFDTLLTVHTDTAGAMGFYPISQFKKDTFHYTFAESLSQGTDKAYHAVTETVKGLARTITGHIPAKKSFHSFIGIANVYGGIWDWDKFWALTAYLSMILAFMNLLPIPALDGGHVIFTLVEMIKGKPLSYRFLDIAQRVGIFLILALMAFALFNDFTEFVFKR